MPALVNSRFGLSGISEDDGTMVCCFDLKKSRNDWRICVLVIMSIERDLGETRGARRVGSFPHCDGGWRAIASAHRTP